MNATQSQTYKLEELAKEAQVSPRTVRYYVQRGLLPPPVFRGRDTVYAADHLVRLRAIRRLQDRHLPLDVIHAELTRRSAEELEQLAEGKGDPSGPYRTVYVPPPILSGRTAGRPPWLPRVRLPDPVSEPKAERTERWTRVRLREGLELHLSEHADARTRQIYEEIRDQVERREAEGDNQ